MRTQDAQRGGDSYVLRQMMLIALLAAYSTAATLPRSLDLPDRPRLREALERVGMRSGVGLPRAGWPLTTAEAETFLDEVIEADSLALTRADSVDLADLLSGPRELWRWENGRGGSQLALNLRATGDANLPDTLMEGSNARGKGSLGGTAYGSFGGEVWFASDARIFTEWNTDYRYQDRYVLGDAEPSGVPFDDPSENGRYKSRTGARYTAWAQWSRDWISLKWGRDRVRFGPGKWTGLTTRLESPPYNLFDTRLEPFRWLSIQATVLEARPGELELAFPGDQRKWAHVHRFELRPVRGLELAFQNQVLYRDSGGVQPSYLLPLVPIFFSQDLAGNRDNSAMQFDARFDRLRGFSLWGGLLLDDLNSLTDIFGAHWLNRWAVLAGGQILSPWRGFDADLAVEWTMVRPWTYTGGREEAYTFAHYGLPMGSELGPDSRTLRGRLAWRPRPGWETRLEGFVLEKGEGPQSRIGWVRRGLPGNEAELFGEGWVGCSGATSGLRWQPWRDVAVDLSGSVVVQADGDGRESVRNILAVGWEADW